MTLSRILANDGGRPALSVAGRAWTHGEIIERSAGLAATLAEADGGLLELIGVIAHKSPWAYAAALAAHLAGKGYVPLNVKFPPRRLAAMVRQSGLSTIVAAGEGFAALAAVLDLMEDGPPVTVIATEAGFPGAGGRHTIIRHRPAAGLAAPRPHRPDAAAYVLFTSGSTGVPKGVAVSFANLEAYLDHMDVVYPLYPGDRASQTFDMTFDLSVHDIFATWRAGACLFPVPDATLLSPARFIRDAGLTVWFSVPSVAMLMGGARTLRRGIFPSLRLSLFCGEPLPVATAGAWAAAAPSSRIVNLYGPTEATIAIAAYEWDREKDEARPAGGIVPIGRPFPGQSHCLLGDNGQVLAPPAKGELCLSGSQVTRGYLDAPEKTASQYVVLPQRGSAVWYRTGDLVEEDAAGLLHHRGRIDFQVKINGYRVELGELEATLRAVARADAVVAVPWPVAGGSAQGLVAFILGAEQDGRTILDACRQTLPAYMVPARIIWKDSLPFNANGKIDRTALAAELHTANPPEGESNARIPD